jgi:hypothetical protein
VRALAIFHRETERLAMRELAARAEGLRAGDPIAPGARVIEWGGSFDELMRTLADNPPVFTQGVHLIGDERDPRDVLREARLGQPWPSYVICRSELKLLESVGLFGIPTPPGELAIDLGAAPGGWSRVLAARGMRVAAVDPGALDPRAADDPLVTHICTTAGQYLKTAIPGSAALLVNDMKMEPERSCAMMLDFAPMLKPGGWAVVTLKLPASAAPSWPGVISRARGVLAQLYSIVGVRQLNASRSEVVCVMNRIQSGI